MPIVDMPLEKLKVYEGRNPYVHCDIPNVWPMAGTRQTAWKKEVVTPVAGGELFNLLQPSVKCECVKQDTESGQDLWAGQRGGSCFSVRWYMNTWMNFLVNSTK